MGYSKTVLALAFFGLVASPATGFGFTLEYSSDGSQVDSGWPASSLSVDLDPSCSGISIVQSALSAAVQIWSSVPTSDLSVSVGSTRSLGSPITDFTGTNPQQYVGGPLVYCDTDFDADFGFTSPSDIPGLELSPTLNCSGSSTFCPIQGGLIVLNADSSDLSNVSNLKTTIVNVVVAHELGHALGLGHSSDLNALMYYDASAKTTLKLTQDDANGISYLYPRNELGGNTPLGCGTVAAVGAGKAGKGTGRGGGSGGNSGPIAEFALMLFALASLRLALMGHRGRRLSAG